MCHLDRSIWLQENNNKTNGNGLQNWGLRNDGGVRRPRKREAGAGWIAAREMVAGKILLFSPRYPQQFLQVTLDNLPRICRVGPFSHSLLR